MTDENCPSDSARLEIFLPLSYARAGAYVDGSAPSTGSEAATLVVEPVGERPADEPARSTAPPTAPPTAPLPEALPGAVITVEQGERPPRLYFPLRRRAANLRDAGHTAYHDAETPWGGVVAALDYVRAADTRAAKAGMYHQPTEEALIAVGRTLMAVGDDLTAAMRTWRPEQ